jgi:RNA polymerase sigma-70 factor, ECF subfamily
MEVEWQRLADDGYYAEVFTMLYETYRQGIRRYCATRLGEHLGEDVMQDVFLTVMQALRTFRPGPPIETWLFGIAKNKCKQALRNRARRQDIATAFLHDIWQQLHPEALQTPLQGMVERERETRLATSLTQLPDLERILLHWRYHKELSMAESAELVGMSEAAVSKRLQRALRRLQELMQDVSRA